MKTESSVVICAATPHTAGNKPSLPSPPVRPWACGLGLLLLLPLAAAAAAVAVACCHAAACCCLLAACCLLLTALQADPCV
eukprot:COSAG06_NODE_1845_length_8230_cov_12.038499_12_plen_81_part_00